MHVQMLKQNVISLTLVAGWGMGIFTVSSVGCGFANGFWTLLAWRIAMGAGEASIINLTGVSTSQTLQARQAFVSTGGEGGGGLVRSLYHLSPLYKRFAFYRYGGVTVLDVLAQHEAAQTNVVNEQV